MKLIKSLIVTLCLCAAFNAHADYSFKVEGKECRNPWIATDYTDAEKEADAIASTFCISPAVAKRISAYVYNEYLSASNCRPGTFQFTAVATYECSQ